MAKPIAAKLPHKGHEKHLCYLVNLRANLTDLRKIVKDGNYICKNCARVAKDKDNLCNPAKL